MGRSQYRNDHGRNILDPYNASPDRVIQVVVEISYGVGYPDHASLQRKRSLPSRETLANIHLAFRVAKNAVPDLYRKVQSPAVLFEKLHYSQTLGSMSESVHAPLTCDLVENPFTHMTEGGVSQIVPQRDSISEILVES